MATTTRPTLSRVQVYLYGVLSLFIGAVSIEAVDSFVDSLPASGVGYAALGALLGGVVSALAVYAVARRARRLPAETRYRLSRLHTLALTGAVLVFLGVVTVEPSLVAREPAAGSFLIPTNVTALFPLVAALTTVLVLGLSRRRERPTRAD